MKLFLISSYAIISTILIVTPSLAFGQEPFIFGNSGDPFQIGGGMAHSDSNTTLQVRSNTGWSGSYGSSTGSTTVDGHDNKDFIFSCSKTYSAMFQKKGEGPGFLTLNIVQPINTVNTVRPHETILNGVTIAPGRLVNASTQINDTAQHIAVAIHSFSNVSMKESITNPSGVIMSNNDFAQQIFDMFKPDIVGKYTLSIHNLGNSSVSVRILFGNLPSQTTITTHNMTNTRTTTAQFGTVSVSGSC